MDKPRGEHAGAIHHVFNHAIDELDLVRDEGDRKLLLDKLAKAAARYGIIIHAYVIMTNHIHLLIETPTPDMGPFMQHFKSSFTKAFNRKHGRKGAIFREKYGNKPIETDSHLKQAHSYIHNNPVKAGITTNPADFPWSSMAAYTGKTKRPTWLTINYFLDLLQGRRNLIKFTNTHHTTWNPHSRDRGDYSTSFFDTHLKRQPPPKTPTQQSTETPHHTETPAHHRPQAQIPPQAEAA